MCAQVVSKLCPSGSYEAFICCQGCSPPLEEAQARGIWEDAREIKDRLQHISRSGLSGVSDLALEGEKQNIQM